MIRLILVVLAVVLYLIFSIPVLFYLKEQTKNDPKAAAKKSLDLVRWTWQGSLMRSGDWNISLPTVQYFMLETTEAILTL